MKRKIISVCIVCILCNILSGYLIFRLSQFKVWRRNEKNITAPLSILDTAKLTGVPVRLRYQQSGEAYNECNITESKTLTACMEALQKIRTGKKLEFRSMDNGETYIFEFENGSILTLNFEGEKYLEDGVCYETEGYERLKHALKSWQEEETQ